MRKLIFIFTLLISLSAFFIDANAQKPTETTSKAGKLMSSGDLKGAIGVLDKAIEKKKDLFEAYRMRSFLRKMTGDFAGAVEDLSSAIEIKPEDGELYEIRAETRLMLRADNETILKDLDMAIANGRKLERVYVFRANIRRQMNDSDGAINDYRTAIGLRPEFAQGHIGLASVYLVNKDDAKAAEVLENFIAIYENSGDKAKVKGNVIASSTIVLPKKENEKETQGVDTVLIQSGTFKVSQVPTSNEEMQKMSEKMEQAKNTALAYTNLAMIYEKRKEYEKALATIEKAFKIDRSDFYAYQIRGRIKAGSGDFSGSLDDLNTSIKMMPRVSSVYLDRGIAYFLMGKDEQAQKDFDQYLQAFPGGRENYEKRLEEAKKIREATAK